MFRIKKSDTNVRNRRCLKSKFIPILVYFEPCLFPKFGGILGHTSNDNECSLFEVD